MLFSAESLEGCAHSMPQWGFWTPGWRRQGLILGCGDALLSLPEDMGRCM